LPIDESIKEFNRIIAWLAVNIDCARVIGCPVVVEPIIVGEPAIGARKRDEFARPRVIEPVGRLGVGIEN
jgi:hypothetical protein